LPGREIPSIRKPQAVLSVKRKAFESLIQDQYTYTMNDYRAAIDIGTNSIHLVVVKANENNRFEIIAQEKEVVRLGSGSKDMKYLKEDAMDRGIEVLKRYKQIADISRAEVKAVATSAVREALNKEVFIQRARTEAGMKSRLSQV
jgi:exopolyphosphatase/pppGpp-phosphohydrolase